MSSLFLQVLIRAFWSFLMNIFVCKRLMQNFLFLIEKSSNFWPIQDKPSCLNLLLRQTSAQVRLKCVNHYLDSKSVVNIKNSVFVNFSQLQMPLCDENDLVFEVTQKDLLNRMKSTHRFVSELGRNGCKAIAHFSVTSADYHSQQQWSFVLIFQVPI